MTTDIITLAQQLMSCSSVTPVDHGCQPLIRSRLLPLGFTCESLFFGEVDNLWARVGNKAPLFVFAGHTDVVPPGPASDWTSSPFKPEIRDGYLYGRGASDMKAAIAAMVIAVERFMQKHPHFPGSIAFLLTSDEEGPAINGTKKVMETLQTRGEFIDYCLIGEPSSDKQIGDQIRVGRRGSLHGNLTVHGKQGHVAHPHLAINPIHQTAEALHELAQKQWDQGNESYPPTTFQITNIHSGTGAANVIPGHLNVLFNFRFGTASTVRELQEFTERILKSLSLSYQLDWKVGAEPFLTKQGRLLTATQQAIKDVTHHDVQLSTGGGTSDGRFIAPTGTEVVELGVQNATAHHVNECVRVEDLTVLADIYERILEKIFS